MTLGVLSSTQYNTAVTKLRAYREGNLVRNGGTIAAGGKYDSIENKLLKHIESDPKTRKLYIKGGKTKGAANLDALGRKAAEIAKRIGPEDFVVEKKWIERFVRRNARLFSIDGGAKGTDNTELPVFDILEMGEDKYVKYSMSKTEDGGDDVTNETKVAFFKQKFRVLKSVPISIRKNYGMQVVVTLKGETFDAILVNPYDIRPGDGREHCFEMLFRQVSGCARKQRTAATFAQHVQG